MFCAGYGQDTVGDSCKGILKQKKKLSIQASQNKFYFKGDSGSPFTVRLDDSRSYLVGIVSWGEGNYHIKIF